MVVAVVAVNAVAVAVVAVNAVVVVVVAVNAVAVAVNAAAAAVAVNTAAAAAAIVAFEFESVVLLVLPTLVVDAWLAVVRLVMPPQRPLI